MAGSNHSRGGARRLVNTILVGLAAALVIAAIYTSALIVQRQAALGEMSRYNATWLVSQAALEVSRLVVALGGINVVGSEIDRDEVQLRLDIVANRLKLLTVGEHGAFIRSRSDLRDVVSALEHEVEHARPIVDQLAANGTTAAVFSSFVPFLPRLNRLAASVHERAGELVAHDLAVVERLGWIFSGLLIGLILCCLGLVAFTRWNYRMLETAHHEVGALASDLHQQNARFDAALNNMSLGLCMGAADLTLVVSNHRFTEMFGLTGALVPGIALTEVYDRIAQAEAVSSEFARTLMVKHGGLIAAGSPGRLMHEEHGWALAMTHRPMQGGGWVTTFEDITEQRTAEARISFMAKHDILTGLPNRLLFRDRLARALSRLGGSLSQVAVLCVDLDRFKQINDTLGHPAGDSLLRIVGARLRNCVSEDDVVARLGGDEFVLFCSAHDRPLLAANVAQRIIDALRAPYDLDGHRAVISASVGIAETREASADPDLLLKNADLALYKAKADGRATYRFFEEAMEAELLHRRSIEMDLGAALEGNNLELHFQPLFGLRRHNLVGFEALVRWRHPERGMIPPAQFIPIAEDTGMIEQIGAWVLNEACAAAARWPEPVKVAVNLSAVQFGAEIVATVADALRRTSLPPALLELEITETILLRDNDRVLATMQELKALGVRIVLDDFGTGYSALSYLRMFPFDKIKIDRSFVRDIGDREDSRAIVVSIVQLAAALGMTTTGEGVETALQAAALREAGCEEVQGFFFARPEPEEQLHKWFGRRLELAG